MLNLKKLFTISKNSCLIVISQKCSTLTRLRKPFIMQSIFFLGKIGTKKISFPKPNENAEINKKKKNEHCETTEKVQ